MSEFLRFQPGDEARLQRLNRLRRRYGRLHRLNLRANRAHFRLVMQRQQMFVGGSDGR